ncbi:MAG: DUF1444 family protein [Planctomycetia bacterium]|nr:DUF1444 family protein [Planctomycetia bacterium]
MLPNTLKTFVHPHGVYRLEFPSYWDQVVQKEGESCGFGPHDRDDVGLWISIMPVSVNTEKLSDELPNLMRQSLQKSMGENMRRDESLRHYGLVADITKKGEGGHYWIVAGGDVVLFASSQVPVAERDVWNPPFQKLMASLRITRDDQLAEVKIAEEVLARLREKHPDQDFAFDSGKIRGKNQVVYLSNLYREIKSAPARRDHIIKNFVEKVSQPTAMQIGQETWEDAQGCIMPMLKPRSYIDANGPTQHLLTTEWLGDVVICYVIQSKKIFRFVTGWDVNRWGTDAQALHRLAIENLAARPWPRELFGARARDSGRVIVVHTEDGLGSSRLLHPDLHTLFQSALGRTFWAGIPCRDRLVLFSDRKHFKQRIGRQLKKDHDTSAYQITPKPFLVTRDGIAPSVDKAADA